MIARGKGWRVRLFDGGGGKLKRLCRPAEAEAEAAVRSGETSSHDGVWEVQ